jgi:hypothetical protein
MPYRYELRRNPPPEGALEMIAADGHVQARKFLAMLVSPHEIQEADGGSRYEHVERAIEHFYNS